MGWRPLRADRLWQPVAFLMGECLAAAYLGVGKSPELPGGATPHTPFAAASDCRTIAIFEYTPSHYFGRFTHAAARCKSIFDNAGTAAAVVERRVRGWRGVRRAKLAEAAAR